MIWISGLALLAHLLQVLVYLKPFNVGMVGMSGLGALLMLGILWVNRREHHPILTLILALAMNAGWLGVDGWHSVERQQGLSSWVQSDGLFMTLLCYAFLPRRIAHRCNMALLPLLCLIAYASGEKDPFLLLLLGFLMLFVGFLSEYGQEVQAAEATSAALRHELNFDVLTGALSRREMMERLKTGLLGGQSGVLLLLDVDHFKRVNDEFGHHVGDEALRNVTHLLKNGVRQGDLVGRWGGEEFLVFLKHVSLSQGQEIADRLVSEINAYAQPHLPRLTVSIGGVPLDSDIGLHEALRQADHCLYRAKARGRNRAILTAPALTRVMPGAHLTQVMAPTEREKEP